MFVTTLVTKVTKRPVNPKYAGYLNYAGFVALMLFMLVVTASDIFKLFLYDGRHAGKMTKQIKDRLCNGGRRRTGDDSVHVQYQYRRCGSDGGTDSSLGGCWLPDHPWWRCRIKLRQLLVGRDQARRFMSRWWQIFISIISWRCAEWIPDRQDPHQSRQYRRGGSGEGSGGCLPQNDIPIRIGVNGEAWRSRCCANTAV